jgi:hypothetical protein
MCLAHRQKKEENGAWDDWTMDEHTLSRRPEKVDDVSPIGDELRWVGNCFRARRLWRMGVLGISLRLGKLLLGSDGTEDSHPVMVVYSC